MKIRQKLFLFISLIAISMFSSCGNDRCNLDVDVSKTPVPNVKINRYEQGMFSIPSDSFLAYVPQMQKKYPLFFRENTDNKTALLELNSFFSDLYMKELNDSVQLQYSDIQDVEKQLSKAMQHYYYYYKLPKQFSYYSYVSGLDIQYPIKIIDSNIVIGLDMYLNANSKFYVSSRFPKYKTIWFKKSSIVPDIMKELSTGLMPEVSSSAKLLDRMIYEGKKIFFTEAMIPDISEDLLLHYKKGQTEWCYDNEARLWSFLIENQFIFKSDLKIEKQFIEDSPFTSIFSTEAPSRLGNFIGWRIVSQYMKKTGVSLNDLMKETNYQKILKESKYKPKR